MTRAINDPVLAEYLSARDADARDHALADLLGRHAEPIARRVLMRYRSGTSPVSREDAEDIASTVNLRLLRKLQTLVHFEGEALADLEGYVVTLTYNTIYDFLRRRFPERSRLKNRTRYLLTHDQRFDLWLAGADAVCALREHGRAMRVRAIGAHAYGSLPGPHDAAGAVERLLRDAGGPVLLDGLVAELAEAWKITDADVPPAQAVADLQPLASATFERQQSIGALWREIRELRPPQRIALLLNSRDGDGASGLVPLLTTDVATIDDLAAAVEMSPETLAERWNELPLDDLTIAGMLGVTRQQVINLRKSARERLTRRMREKR